jgi:hypothetical protein
VRVRDPRPVGLLLIALTAVACGTTGTPSSAAVGSAAPTAGTTPSSATDDQTDTDWGRIWDTLPSGFPMYPSAARSEEARAGPSSGVYVVVGKNPSVVVTWFENALQAASYSTETPSGPLEDRGYVLDATGTAGCRMELTIAPLGGLTSLKILYGAACRH